MELSSLTKKKLPCAKKTPLFTQVRVLPKTAIL